jgi:hypothetical protein
MQGPWIQSLGRLCNHEKQSFQFGREALRLHFSFEQSEISSTTPWMSEEHPGMILGLAQNHLLLSCEIKSCSRLKYRGEMFDWAL